MTTEQLTITISAPDRLGLSIATDGLPLKRPTQVDLFRPQSDEGVDQPPSEVQLADTQTEAKAKKTPPAASPQAEEPKKPWEDLSQKPTGTNFMPDPELHAKMAWVSANVPGGMSRLRILREGAMAECDRLIALHYRP